MSGGRRWRAPLRTAALLLGAAVATTCGDRPAERDGAYVVEVDLSPLIAALGDDEGEADDAAERLAALGPAVVPALAAALEREPPRVRERVVGILADLPAEQTAPLVLRLAERDEDHEVRGAALRALGSLAPRGALETVLSAFGNPQPAIRAGAVQACGRLCTPPEAVERLADLAIRDADLSVALGARAALAALRDRGGETEAAVRAAVARRRPDTLAPDAPTDQRVLAALLAADLEGPAAADPLVALAPAAAPPLQRQIAWTLGRFGDARAVPALRALLGGADVLVQAYAYDALVKLQGRGIAGAAEALAAYTGPRPLGALRAPDV